MKNAYMDLLKNFEISGELDITEIYNANKDLTLALLTIATRYKDRIKMLVENDVEYANINFNRPDIYGHIYRNVIHAIKIKIKE